MLLPAGFATVQAQEQTISAVNVTPQRHQITETKIKTGSSIPLLSLQKSEAQAAADAY